MKCLLCAQRLDDEEQLRKHYIDFYKVDPFNHFFQKLFKSTSEIFKPRKCLQCYDFSKTTKLKAIHSFLKHYNEGKFNPFEGKPIDTIRQRNLTRYEISVQKHKGN